MTPLPDMYDYSPLPDPESAFDCFLGQRDFSVLDANNACY